MKLMEFSTKQAVVGEEMRVLADFILSDDGCCLLPMEERQMAAIALEEAFVNVCSYAYGGRPGYIKVFVVKTEDFVTVHIFDRGAYFDPSTVLLSEPDPDQVGGHGIRLIREYAYLVYEYKNGENHLQMVVPKCAMI